jgi:hypothetical protein
MAPEADGVFAWWNSKSRYAQAEDLATIWDGVFQSHSWGTGVPKNNQYGTVSVEMDRIALDLEELMNWFTVDAELPRTVIDASFDPTRLESLRSRNSAAYKGINVLILREGAKDFFWKGGIQELDKQDVELDIHHIFPRAWCETQGLSYRVYDAIINKTPISARTNRMIGGDAPSHYLARLQDHQQVQLGDEAMNAILEGHRIPTEALRADDFHAFYSERKGLLLEIIEKAMGKKSLVGSDEGQQAG